MSKFIKSNIEARFSSLIDGAHEISLFQTNRLLGHGIYLQPHQEHLGKNNDKETVIITVFHGTGELELIEHGEKPLHLQIMSGDIFAIPTMSEFKILNIDQSCMILSALTIR